MTPPIHSSNWTRRWTEIVCRQPLLVILAALALSLGLASQLPKLQFQMDVESFLDDDDPALLDYYAFQDYFGRSQTVVLAVEIPNGQLDALFLERLWALQADLDAGVPYLEDSTSLLNVRQTEAQDDEIQIDDLVEFLPTTDAEIQALQQKIASDPLYPNLIISPDGSWTQITLETNLFVDPTTQAADAGDDLDFGFDETTDADFASPSGAESLTKLGDVEDLEILTAVREIVEAHRKSDFEVRVGGEIAVQLEIEKTMKRDFAKVLGLALLIISGLLYVFFRRIDAVLLVVSVVLFSLLGSIGFMAAAQIPVGLGTQILPTFLMAVGVGYSVHVLTFFRANQREGLDRISAARLALLHAARPILLTALTTLGGLVSFIPTELAPISQIGLFAPVGVLMAAALSLSLLPALLVVLPLREPAPAVAVERLQRAVVELGTWSIRHQKTVFWIAALILVVAGAGLSQIRSSHDPVSWLRQAGGTRQSTETINEHLGGAANVEFLVEARPGYSLRDPAILQKLDRIEERVLALDVSPVRAGKFLGLHQVVKEINQVLEGDDPAAYRIPDDPELVAQELILFENGGLDDLEKMVDPTYSLARLTIRTGREDAYHFVPFVDAVLEIARQELGGMADVQPAGMQSLLQKTFVNVNSSMQRSYALALIVVSLLLVPMIGNIRVGLIAILPNLVPIAVAMGCMGWLGIPMSTMTLLVGSIALGLAVDDTIHFTHGFLHHERESGDAEEAVRQTLKTTGAAILFTSVALVAGFSMFVFGGLWAMVHFGIVSAMAIAAAFLSDITLLPALLVWLSNRTDAMPAGAPSAFPPLETSPGTGATGAL